MKTTIKNGLVILSVLILVIYLSSNLMKLFKNNTKEQQLTHTKSNLIKSSINASTKNSNSNSNLNSNSNSNLKTKEINKLKNNNIEKLTKKLDTILNRLNNIEKGFKNDNKTVFHERFNPIEPFFQKFPLNSNMSNNIPNQLSPFPPIYPRIMPTPRYIRPIDSYNIFNNRNTFENQYPLKPMFQPFQKNFENQNLFNHFNNRIPIQPIPLNQKIIDFIPNHENFRERKQNFNITKEDDMDDIFDFSSSDESSIKSNIKYPIRKKENNLIQNEQLNFKYPIGKQENSLIQNKQFNSSKYPINKQENKIIRNNIIENDIFNKIDEKINEIKFDKKMNEKNNENKIIKKDQNKILNKESNKNLNKNNLNNSLDKEFKEEESFPEIVRISVFDNEEHANKFTDSIKNNTKPTMEGIEKSTILTMDSIKEMDKLKPKFDIHDPEAIKKAKEIFDIGIDPKLMSKILKNEKKMEEIKDDLDMIIDPKLLSKIIKDDKEIKETKNDLDMIIDPNIVAKIIKDDKKIKKNENKNKKKEIIEDNDLLQEKIIKKNNMEIKEKNLIEEKLLKELTEAVTKDSLSKVSENQENEGKILEEEEFEKNTHEINNLQEEINEKKCKNGKCEKEKEKEKEKENIINDNMTIIDEKNINEPQEEKSIIPSLIQDILEVEKKSEEIKRQLE